MSLHIERAQLNLLDHSDYGLTPLQAAQELWGDDVTAASSNPFTAP
jgi:hypothetical protein